MTAQPTDGLHVLRNAWAQRSFMAALPSARCGARGGHPRNSARHAPPAGSRQGLLHRLGVPRRAKAARGNRSKERGAKNRDASLSAYGPTGALGPTDLWERLVGFQVPLFEMRQRKDWGHIDLLALGADGRPIVIELKKHDSRETPLPS